jgi:hypothetical protein
VQDASAGIDSDLLKTEAVMHGLCFVSLCRAGGGLDFVDPVLPVNEVQPGRAEVDWRGSRVRGVVYGLAELHRIAEMLRPEPSPVQPQLPAAVIQVLDVHAADVRRADHSTSPGVYRLPFLPWIFSRPTASS